MRHGHAYEVVARELERWGKMTYDALIARVGMPPKATSADINGERICVEVNVEWLDPSRNAVRVCATANGPST